jgi:hypothetical protein
MHSSRRQEAACLSVIPGHPHPVPPTSWLWQSFLQEMREHSWVMSLGMHRGLCRGPEGAEIRCYQSNWPICFIICPGQSGLAGTGGICWDSWENCMRHSASHSYSLLTDPWLMSLSGTLISGAPWCPLLPCSGPAPWPWAHYKTFIQNTMQTMSSALWDLE